MPEFPSSREATDWYRAEQSNLLAVVRAASAAGLFEVAWRMPTALHGMHAVHLPVDDWLEMARLAMDAAEALEDQAGQAAAQATLADAYAAAGSTAQALQHHEAVLAMRQEAGDPAGIATSAISLGMIYLRQHRLGAGRQRLRQGPDGGSEQRH